MNRIKSLFVESYEGIFEEVKGDPNFIWLLAYSDRMFEKWDEIHTEGGLKLDGVKGVSGTNKIVWEHAHVRDIAFRTLARVARRWNDLEPIDYSDPEKLWKDDARLIQRIVNSVGMVSQVFAKLQKYIVGAADEPNFKNKVVYGGVIDSFGYWVKKSDFHFDTVEEVVDEYIRWANSDIKEEVIWYAKSSIEGVSREDLIKWFNEGAVAQVSIYSDEEEWEVKGDSYIIPKKGTRVYLKGLPQNYESEIEVAKLMLGGLDKKEALKKYEEEQPKSWPSGWGIDEAYKVLKIKNILDEDGWEVVLVDPKKLEKTQLRKRTR